MNHVVRKFRITAYVYDPVIYYINNDRALTNGVGFSVEEGFVLVVVKVNEVIILNKVQVAHVSLLADIVSYEWWRFFEFIMALFVFMHLD